MVHGGNGGWWWRVGLITVAVAVLAVGLSARAAPLQVHAWQETATVPPSPDECTVEPRRLPLELETPAATGAAASPTVGQPTPVPQGSVDDETLNAITDTVRQAIACQNAGDILREFALYTDAFLARYFAGPDALSEQDFATAVAADPAPVPLDEQLTFVEIRDARWLEDGRARAVVVTEGTEGPFSDRLTFAREGDRWLIDEFVAVESPATGTTEAENDEATAAP